MDRTSYLQGWNDAIKAMEEAKNMAVQQKPQPLTRQQVLDLLNDEDYFFEQGNHIWVQELQLGCVIPGILDVWNAEPVAVTTAMQDGSGWYWGHDYGVTWVLYLEKPVFDE